MKSLMGMSKIEFTLLVLGLFVVYAVGVFLYFEFKGKKRKKGISLDDNYGWTAPSLSERDEYELSKTRELFAIREQERLEETKKFHEQTAGHERAIKSKKVKSHVLEEEPFVKRGTDDADGAEDLGNVPKEKDIEIDTKENIGKETPNGRIFDGEIGDDVAESMKIYQEKTNRFGVQYMFDDDDSN